MAVRDTYDVTRTKGDTLADEKRRASARQIIQDETAVHLLSCAFDRLDNGRGGALDIDLAVTFLMALDDGSARDIPVHVSNRRAKDLIKRVKAFDSTRAGLEFKRVARDRVSALPPRPS